MNTPFNSVNLGNQYLKTWGKKRFINKVLKNMLKTNVVIVFCGGFSLTHKY